MSAACCAGLLLAFLLATTLHACREDRTRPPGTEETMHRRPIEQVLSDHTPELMALPGVVGTYEGALDDGSPCIKVMVVSSTPELAARIPRALEGYPVVIDVTGEIRALPGKKP